MVHFRFTSSLSFTSTWPTLIVAHSVHLAKAFFHTILSTIHEVNMRISWIGLREPSNGMQNQFPVECTKVLPGITTDHQLLSIVIFSSSSYSPVYHSISIHNQLYDAASLANVMNTIGCLVDGEKERKWRICGCNSIRLRSSMLCTRHTVCPISFDLSQFFFHPSILILFRVNLVNELLGRFRPQNVSHLSQLRYQMILSLKGSWCFSLNLECFSRVHCELFSGGKNFHWKLTKNLLYQGKDFRKPEEIDCEENFIKIRIHTLYGMINGDLNGNILPTFMRNMNC